MRRIACDSMDAHEDAQLRLAAFRHPAARVVGTLHLAQRQVAEAATAFLTLMAGAGDPGAGPLPPPRGRHRWPRGHRARSVRGWPVAVPVDDGFACWLDTESRWWTVRFDEDGGALDTYTVGSPVRAAEDLARCCNALDEVLRACGVPR
jgi:hypothetical protein